MKWVADEFTDANGYITIREDDGQADAREYGKTIATVRGVSKAVLVEAAPDLLAACKAMGAKRIPWVHNAGITSDIEALRRICLAYADVWNNVMRQAIAKAEGSVA